MSIKTIFFLLSWFFLLGLCPKQAQTQEAVLGALPALSISKSLAERLEMNLKVESRFTFFEKENSEQLSANYYHERTSFSLTTARKIFYNHSVAIAYMYRIKEGKSIHRTTQQYSLPSTFFNQKAKHRFAFDQTYEADKNTKFRVRYRLSFQVPLNGLELDAKEFYLKFNNEYLHLFQKENSYEMEIRWLGMIGFSVMQKSKLEIGINYRKDKLFVKNEKRDRAWLAFNWYYSF